MPVPETPPKTRRTSGSSDWGIDVRRAIARAAEHGYTCTPHGVPPYGWDLINDDGKTVFNGKIDAVEDFLDSQPKA